MILGKTPGINVIFPFYEIYSEENPLDIKELFNNPEREKHGYLWKDLYPSIVKQTSRQKYHRKPFIGIYVSSYEEAAICISLFNRYFYLSLISRFDWFLNSFSQNGIYHRKMVESGYDRDEIIWTGFYEYLKDCFNYYYVPFKRFLASKRPDKCWVSFDPQPLSPKDPVYSDFLCGLPSVEVLSYYGHQINFTTEHWESAIKEGPLEHPEIPILKDFIDYFPGTVKYIPEHIFEKIDIGSLRELKDFGLI
jgi:hypothetical protein